MLEPTVGAGRVVARVSTSLDWTQSESTEERFDPDSQVARSEEITKETEGAGSERASGAPGIASNTANVGGGGGGSSPEIERSTETINYEISKTLSRTVSPVGTLQHLDVAVLVDGVPTEDGSFQAWDEEALREFEELAKRAVGFSEERGDRFTLTSAPFRSIEVEMPGASFLSPELLLLASTLLRFAGIVIAVFVFAKLVAAPLGARVLGEATSPLPARAADLEMQLAGAGAEASELPAPAPPQNDALPLQGGEEAVKALRAWLSER